MFRNIKSINRGIDTEASRERVGVRQDSAQWGIPVLLLLGICFEHILSAMSTKPTPESLLQDIAQIERMDRGSVSVIRQGPEGAYYNHQCYEKGRNVSRYVSGDQVADLKEAIEGYRRLQQLVEQYVQLLVEKTRTERQAGSKKKTQLRNSSLLKTRKSNS
jgi:hypothetical protein